MGRTGPRRPRARPARDARVMDSISLKLRFSSATIAVAAGIAAWSSPALAQPPGAPAAGGADPNSQPIVVTGSRIRRDPLDQGQPVTFVDRADIDRTGLSS